MPVIPKRPLWVINYDDSPFSNMRRITYAFRQAGAEIDHIVEANRFGLAVIKLFDADSDQKMHQLVTVRETTSWETILYAAMERISGWVVEPCDIVLRVNASRDRLESHDRVQTEALAAYLRQHHTIHQLLLDPIQDRWVQGLLVNGHRHECQDGTCDLIGHATREAASELVGWIQARHSEAAVAS